MSAFSFGVAGFQAGRPVIHPARAVRLASCQCLWALVLAFPERCLAPLLNVSRGEGGFGQMEVRVRVRVRVRARSP